MSHVSDIYEIRTRDDFSANDITLWLVDVFKEEFEVDPTKFKTEVYIREENIRGRADIVIQDSIGVETKSNLKKEKDKALEQVENILTKLEGEGNTSPIGIATDGERWEFYVLVEEEPFEFFSFHLSKGTDDEELKNNLWQGLTVLRRKTGRTDPTAEAVAETFRPYGPAYNEITSQLAAQIEEIVKNDQVEFTSKFIPWFELFSFVYNDFSEKCRGLSEEAEDHEVAVSTIQELDQVTESDYNTLNGAVELFIRHTYLALTAKSLSALVTLGEAGVASHLSDCPEEIVTGEAIRQNGIEISDPNDFFVWPRAGKDTDKVVNSIMKPLQRFSDDYTDDVFRHLYEIVVDPETRHELGEFYTPKWIAQLIIEDTVTDYNESVIDPACGSGTFLVFSMKKKLEKLKDRDGEITIEDVNSIIDEVWGIDVNPLSVILARTNIYLTIVSDLEGSKHPPEIAPEVYTADTFILPRYDHAQQRLNENEDDSEVILTPITPNITIPVLPSLAPDEALEWVTRSGELLMEGKEHIPEGLDQGGSVGDYQQAVLDEMHGLRKRYGDNLWRFVLRNYGIPPLLRGEFDIVVGNPPWLSFREARENIKSTMEELIEAYDISPPVQAKTSFNLAIPFMLTSQDFINRQDGGGVISFVLPLSVLESPAHVPFIKMLQSRDEFKIQEVYDLEDIAPYPFPHALPSAILTVRVAGGK